MDFAVMAANVPHSVLKSVRDKAALPGLSIVDEESLGCAELPLLISETRRRKNPEYPAPLPRGRPSLFLGRIDDKTIKRRTIRGEQSVFFNGGYA